MYVCMYMSPRTSKCVRIPPYMCRHIAMYVSAYCYICVAYCYMCPHTAVCFRIPLYMCPHTTICVPILLYMCLHTRVQKCPSSALYMSRLRDSGVHPNADVCSRKLTYAHVCSRMQVERFGRAPAKKGTPVELKPGCWRGGCEYIPKPSNLNRKP